MEREMDNEIILLLKDLQNRMTHLEQRMEVLVKQSSKKSLGVKNYSSSPRTQGGQGRYKDKRDGLNKPNSRRTVIGRSDERKPGLRSQAYPKKNQAYDPSTKKSLE